MAEPEPHYRVWDLLMAERRRAVCDYFGLPANWEPPRPDEPLSRAQAIEKLEELERIMRERPRPGRAGEG